jgi:hypothetical protein
MAHKFKILLICEHHGEPVQQEVIAEYQIEEVKGSKIRFIPSSNRIKKDILTYLKGDGNETAYTG